MATRARHFEAALSGFRNNSGASLSGGKLQFYVSGTSTPKNAYTDREKTQPVTEVALDSNGRAEVFGDGWYDIKLLDASDSVLDTFEYVYLQRASFTVETKTESFTATTDVDVYLVDTTNGNVVVTYPPAADIEYPIEIAKKTDDGNTVTIDPYNTETINGEASFTLDAPNQSVMVASDGANLYTLGAFVNTAVTITTEATTAVKGKTRYATEAETIAGTEEAAATTPASVKAAYDGLFKGYHEGLILSNNTVDPSYDIDISAGTCRDAGNTAFIRLSAAVTKRIDAVWAAGDDAGGFPSGLTLTADTFYRVFVIRNPSTGTTDAGFDTSATAANLLTDATGYTQYRQVGWIKTNSTPTIIKMGHSGGGFYRWDVPVRDHSATSFSTSAALKTLSAPPGTAAEVNIYISLATGSITFFGLFTETWQTDTAPTATESDLKMVQNANEVHKDSLIITRTVDANSQIRVRGSGTTPQYELRTIGYRYLWD